MFLAICPSCHHRDEQVENGEFPLGAVTCTTCGAPYAPIHEADVRHSILTNWAPSEGVAFDDEGPIEDADAKRFENFLADGYWFVKVFPRDVMSGPHQFEFTCIRRQDPHAYMDTALAEDAEWIRDLSEGVAQTTIDRNGDTYTLTATFTGPDETQTDTYYLIKGF